MPSPPTTYQRVCDLIADYVKPLEAGTFGYPISLIDENGRPLGTNDDFISGKFLILTFIRSLEDTAAQSELAALANVQGDIARMGGAILTISPSSSGAKNQIYKKTTGFNWPILGDATGSVFAAYGLHKDITASETSSLRTVLLTPLRQVRAFFDTPHHQHHAEKVMQIMQDAALAEESRWAPPHAPVLLIPNVFSADECAAMIKHVESDQKFTVNRNQWAGANAHTDIKIPSYEHNRQDRIDHIVHDKNLVSFIDGRIATRVTPMIHKAFAFDVTRREDLHIARYTGAREGAQMGHRDNTNPNTAYRRFALSVNLNDDFEGGEVVFREYSNRGYKGSAGTCMIFSSALLHEVLETTKGVRYNLISHFFNDTKR